MLLLVVVSGCGLVCSAIAPVMAPVGEGICGMADVGITVCVGFDGVRVVSSGGGAFGVYGGGGGVGFITTNGSGPSLRFLSDVVLGIGAPKAVATERGVGDCGDVPCIPAGTSISLLSSATDCSTF